MKALLLTSSVLILALLALRFFFRRAVSRRMQYALWGLVLARLLIPVNLPAADFSVLTAAEPAGQQVSAQLEQRRVYVLPTGQVPLPEQNQQSQPLEPGDELAPTSMGVWVVNEDGATATTYAGWMTTAEVLWLVWLAGLAVTTACFVMTNLRFWRKIRKVRTPYTICNCKRPVYLVESGLPSPCLFGLFRPAIYLTPAALATPERLRHVLAHESTHARHLDPLWGLLRCACLAIYWFDPLVWVAAIVSKSDCELACDEGALQRLGEAERLPYGQTLLSLIPVRRGPVNPLLSATTMTAGKRRLKDRITRIAEHRRTLGTAMFAVAALAALVCAVTFTGGKTGGHSTGATPLTGDELAYFNEAFFNGPSFNIRNQFLSSLYETPADINLFSLFYAGDGLEEPMGDDEWQQVGLFDENGDLVCDCVKLSAANINQILAEHTGLTLAETNQVDLDAFTYLPEYDAYYDSHGDTNYRAQVTFSAGEQQGDTVRLYYDDDFFSGGWKCVTLEAQTDGSYHFVSHLFSEKPALPTVFPAGEPALTVPLTGLTAYAPEATTPARHTDDCAERHNGILIDDDTAVRIYRSTDGNLYAAVEYETVAGSGVMTTWDVGVFFTFPAEVAPEQIVTTGFYDLFGHSGVVLSYPGQVARNLYGTVNDYYYMDGGVPVLLARAYGTPELIDLDGNGETELAASAGGPAQLFFQREGRLYQADLAQLLSEHWTTAQYLEFGSWDLSRRSVPLWAYVPIPGYENDPTVSALSALRTLYFDGEQLLLYRDDRTYTDHVSDDVDAPAEVLAAAKANALEALSWWQTHTGGQSFVDGVWQNVGPQAEWDDWRITSLELTDTAPAYPQLGLQIYRLSYELHSPTPEKVQAAGGMYVTEDGWAGGFYVETPFLIFHSLRNSGLTLLENDIPGDVGGSSDVPMFAAAVAKAALKNGLLEPSQVRDVDLYYLFYTNQTTFLNLLGGYGAAEQETALHRLAAYAASDGIEDAGLLADGLENLERNSSALTEAGRAAYVRLLAAVAAPGAVDAEAALDRFTADPTQFLKETAALTLPAQTALCQALAGYYSGGTAPQRTSFRAAMVSVRQPGLGADATAVYELLRTSCPLPGPAKRTEADEAAILATVNTQLEQGHAGDGVLSFDVLQVTVDEAETARIVSNSVANLLANANGWADDYTAKMTAVQAVWDVSYGDDALANDPDLESGRSARYFYLLPNAATGAWEIWASKGCAVPERYRTAPDTLPLAEEPAVTVTRSASLPEAYAAMEGMDGFILAEQLDGPGCTVVSWAQGGTSHGTAPHLSVFYPDGTVAALPLPWSDAMSRAAPENLFLSADGSTLTYTVFFADSLGNPSGDALLHKAGTYHYRYDVAATVITLNII